MAKGRTIFFLICMICVTNLILCDKKDSPLSDDEHKPVHYDGRRKFQLTNRYEEPPLRPASPVGASDNDDDGYLNKLWRYYHGYKRDDVDATVLPKHYLYTPNYQTTNTAAAAHKYQPTTNNEPTDDMNDDVSTHGYTEESESERVTISTYGSDNPNSDTSSVTAPTTSATTVTKLAIIRKPQKRSANKQTDPKIEDDLNQYFRGEQQGDPTKKLFGKMKIRIPKKYKKTLRKSKNIEKKDNVKSDLNKEVFSSVPEPPEKKSMELKKKSINWSDYFGLDRRKKSENSDGLDKEWLLERYHNAIALSAKKRNGELPLKSFRNHNLLLSGQDFIKSDEEKINEMDAKLQKVEDQIVEQALKYSGAHQGNRDPNELKHLRTAIIARLAQAYNIEKMRDTLEEYKNKLDHSGSNSGKSNYGNYFTEEKRLGVPRKEAIDPNFDGDEIEKAIKCLSSDDCHDENYKTSPNYLNHFGAFDQCPAIQRACNDIASLVGHYGHVFEAACHIHQMCMLCGSTSWFSPTRPCNMLYLTKVYDLCSGKEECKEEARRSIRYLLDMNKSLQCQSDLNDECELHCPDETLAN